MPMSSHETFSKVIWIISHEKPHSILDVGCGDGFYGVAFRRYLDGNVADGRGLHKKDTWQHRIDGLEIYPDYKNPIHDYFYNQILWGVNALEYFQNPKPSQTYDCIFMGDIIEHLEKSDGMKMILNARNHLNENGILLIVTPIVKDQWHESPNDNPREAHLSLWDEYDFDFIEGFRLVNLLKNGKLFVMLARE